MANELEDPGQAAARAVLDRAAERINAAIRANTGRGVETTIDMMEAIVIGEADHAVLTRELEPYLDPDGMPFRVGSGQVAVELDYHGLTIGLVYFHRMQRHGLRRFYPHKDEV